MIYKEELDNPGNKLGGKLVECKKHLIAMGVNEGVPLLRKINHVVTNTLLYE